nr:ionotropic receptor 6 [Gregopimpla kuwanae]
MFTLFSGEIWSLIGAIIIILSLASLAMERILVRHGGRQLRSRSYAEHFFYVSSTLFNQVNAVDSIASGSKILSLTISVFCWLILIGYSSHLIYSMTEETLDAPFDNLDTLFESTNFHIAVLHGSVAHSCFTSAYTYEIFKRIWKKNRVKVVSNVEALYRQVCSNPHKYVLLDAVDTMSVRKNTECSLIPVGEAYFAVPVASGISRRLKSKRSLDIGIMKLHEYGIIDALKKRYMSRPNRASNLRLTDDLAIDMDRVSMIFGILCFGICASIVVCLAENMHFTFKKRDSTIESLIKRLPIINRIIKTKIR